MNEPDVHPTPDASSVVPEGIRQLLERRQTYEEWLARLDDVGDQYRSEVAERVRSDYRARLSEVAGELEGHRHDLESALDERRGRLTELAEGFERRSAELEEAELRFKVGEFDETTWDDQRQELTTGLEEIETELDGARNAVDELEQVLHRLGDDAQPAQPMPVESLASAPREPTTDVAVEAEAEADEEFEVEPEADAHAEDPDANADAEADVVPLHVADEDAAGSGAGEEESDELAASTAKRGDAESDEYLDELEFLESLSLDDPDTFDAVSRMLDDEEDH